MKFQQLKTKKILLILAILSLSLILFGCENNTNENTTEVSNSSETSTNEENSSNNEKPTQTDNNADENTGESSNLLGDSSATELDLSTHPIATMTIKDMGNIEILLLPEIAPNTVNNFISLAQNDFYNGLIFHRVIKDFMIQGGDPTGTGTGGPKYSIKGEFTMNNFDNPLSHTSGVISMARSNHPDSAGSQFFIVHKDSLFLDGQYAGFGVVIDGMDIVDKIAETPTGANDRPTNDVIIESVTIELNGYEAKEPEKVLQ